MTQPTTAQSSTGDTSADGTEPGGAQDPGWTFSSSAMDDMCRCEHRRKYHAFPGAGGTPCTAVGCCCDIFVYADAGGVWAGLTPPYATIVADPPWRFASAATKAHAGKHYTTMPLADICALPVADLAATDAHLWLWAVNGLMEEAFTVVRAWGFRPITVLTWCKRQPGVGYYLRNNTEHAIFATRGKPMVPAEKPMASWFVWSRTHHSAKPVGFFQVVEQVSPGPYVELFSRDPQLGWDSWGHGYEIARGAAS